MKKNHHPFNFDGNHTKNQKSPSAHYPNLIMIAMKKCKITMNNSKLTIKKSNMTVSQPANFNNDHKKIQKKQ